MLTSCQSPGATAENARDRIGGESPLTTARAYDIEYDLENDVITSIHERPVDAEWSAESAQARLDFFGDQDTQGVPWTQMRVDYSFDETVYPGIHSVVRTEVGEDFLDGAAKAYGG